MIIDMSQVECRSCGFKKSESIRKNIQKENCYLTYWEWHCARCNKLLATKETDHIYYRPSILRRCYRWIMIKWWEFNWRIK